MPKTNFFNLIWFDAMLTNVLNTVLRPYELADRHSAILGKEIGARNELHPTEWVISRAEASVFCELGVRDEASP